MNECAEIQRQLRAAEVLDERGRAHLEGCAACAAMAVVARRLPDPERRDHDGGPQWSALADAMAAERGARAWGRQRPTTIRVAVSLAVALAVPMLVLAFAPRIDLGVYPAARLALELGCVAAIAVWVIALTLRPLQRPFSTRTRAVALAAGVLAAMIIASLPPAHHDHAASLAGGGEDFVRRAIGCLIYGSVMAMPAVLVLLSFSREPRSEPRAALLAAGAALIGFAAVGAHCPIVLSEHLWAGHVAVFVPLFVFAAWLGRRRAPAR